MLTLTNISKSYRTSEIETLALSNVSFSVGEGEFVAVTGPSGCGKSTLLNVLGLLDRPDSGSYRLFDHETSGASERALIELRRSTIGFIFQSFNLIDDLNAWENVEVGLIYRGYSAKERRRRIDDALARVDMKDRSGHLPSQLSGGQQQRVAVARALVSCPKLILADEPTGNLDTPNGRVVTQLLADAAADGTTVVMVTHSMAQVAVAARVIKMLDGAIVGESKTAE